MVSNNGDLYAGLTPDAPPAPYDWDIRDLGMLVNEPPPVHIVNGMLIEGGVSMLFAPIKTGKSRLLMSLLKALSPDGPQFCGQTLAPTPTLLFTEEPPNVLGERVREFGIPTGIHFHNYASALTRDPEAFAEDIYREYQQHGAGFGIIAIDTMNAFINCPDWNDYRLAGAALAPIRQLARVLPSSAVLLIHHTNKADSDGWGGALGSTALGGAADQMIRMGKRDGALTLKIGGRYNPAPFPWDESIRVEITPEGVNLLGSASGAAGDVLAEHLTDAPTTIKALLELAGDDAPSRNTVKSTLDEWIKEGRAQLVTERAGSRAATYRMVEESNNA